MKSNRLLLGIATAAFFCGAANARNILIDNWQPQGTSGGSDTVTAFPTNVEGFSLTGITSLSFSPGSDETNGWAAGYLPTAPATSPLLEYAFGTSLAVPDEQIIINPMGPVRPGPASEFTVSFNYNDGFGVGQTASLTVNGVTYTNTNPTVSTSAVDFDFVGGILKSTTFAKVAVSAPEIDPASATSALTLLAGGLAIALGSKRRKLAQHAA